MTEMQILCFLKGDKIHELIKYMKINEHFDGEENNPEISSVVTLPVVNIL